jgi:hypothetical protein
MPQDTAHLAALFSYLLDTTLEVVTFAVPSVLGFLHCHQRRDAQWFSGDYKLEARIRLWL